MSRYPTTASTREEKDSSFTSRPAHGGDSSYSSLRQALFPAMPPIEEGYNTVRIRCQTVCLARRQMHILRLANLAR
jgi:hypothetical protein